MCRILNEIELEDTLKYRKTQSQNTSLNFEFDTYKCNLSLAYRHTTAVRNVELNEIELEDKLQQDTL